MGSGNHKLSYSMRTGGCLLETCRWTLTGDQCRVPNAWGCTSTATHTVAACTETSLIFFPHLSHTRYTPVQSTNYKASHTLLWRISGPKEDKRRDMARIIWNELGTVWSHEATVWFTVFLVLSKHKATTKWSRFIPPSEHRQRHELTAGGIFVSEATET